MRPRSGFVIYQLSGCHSPVDVVVFSTGAQADECQQCDSL